jgi:6-phosphogluconolactonase
MELRETPDWVTGSETGVAERAAAFVTAAAYRSLADHGRFTVALAGGGTPRRLYALLAGGVDESVMTDAGYDVPFDARRSAADTRLIILPWRHTLLFQGDERYLPANHPDSNYGMVRETLIRHICIPPQQVVRMPVESGDAASDAERYEQLLRGIFRKPDRGTREGFPVFDLVMLGLGDDGHTASLFPEDRIALEETRRWAIAVEAPRADPPGARLTLTLPVINNAATVMFLVPERRCELARSIRNGEHPEMPAGRVRPVNGRLLWFVAC